jgi:hypothetical protein
VGVAQGVTHRCVSLHVSECAGRTSTHNASVAAAQTPFRTVMRPRALADLGTQRSDQTIADSSSGKAAPYGGIGSGVHSRATHVCTTTHGTLSALGRRARPPHAPPTSVVQQLRPAAQSPFDAQRSPSPRFAEAVAVAAGVLDAAGAIVTVAPD